MVHDPRIPPADRCVLADILDRQCASQPNKVFLVFEDGESWTYAETRSRARQAAAAFRELGVAKGEHVLSWLPNGKEAILAWFGLNQLGAVYVPVNTSYRGGLLEHVVALSDAKLMVVHAQLLPRLADIALAALKDVVVVGGEGVPIDGLTLHGPDALTSSEEVTDAPAPWETVTQRTLSSSTIKAFVRTNKSVHVTDVCLPQRAVLWQTLSSPQQT